MKTKLLFLKLFFLVSFCTYSQTFELFDFNLTGDFQPKYFTEYNGMLIFQARDNNGIELWKSDGTLANTKRIKDIDPNGSSNPRYFKEYKGKLYFIASDKLWVTDGTEEGTQLVSNKITPISLFSVANNLLFFVGDSVNEGKELWASDGTDSGTYMVKNINPSSWSSLSFNSQLMPYNNKIIFAANDGENGIELWSSDGTSQNTTMIKDIYNGDSSFPQYFTEYKGKIYFSATEVTHGTELWKTDGTPSGTELVKDIYNSYDSSYPSKFFVYSESLFFQAKSDEKHGAEMHKYTFASDNVSRVVDIYDGKESGGFSPRIEYNEGLYFTASKPETGIELYVRRNGSTILAEDVNPGSKSSSPTAFCKCAGKMYFRAQQGSENGLFEFDTSGNATKIAPSSATNQPFYTSITTELFCFKNNLYFAANYTSSGFDLWKLAPSTLSSEINVKDDYQLSLYPNPASTNTTISLKENSIQSLKIYSLLGKQIVNRSVSNQRKIQVNISTLPKGIYFVKVKTDAKSITQKLIIK